MFHRRGVLMAFVLLAIVIVSSIARVFAPVGSSAPPVRPPAVASAPAPRR